MAVFDAAFALFIDGTLSTLSAGQPACPVQEGRVDGKGGVVNQKAKKKAIFRDFLMVDPPSGRKATAKSYNRQGDGMSVCCAQLTTVL
jgi:hypothetical protein